MIQTPSDTQRHHPDTTRHRRFYLLEGTGRKSNIWAGMTFIHFYQHIWYYYTPDTLRFYPDTLRHNPDTPRHWRFYAIQGTGIKDNIWVSWPNIIFLPTDLVLICSTGNLPYISCPILNKNDYVWGCLDGVWGVWMVSGWCLRVSRIYEYQIPL